MTTTTQTPLTPALEELEQTIKATVFLPGYRTVVSYDPDGFMQVEGEFAPGSQYPLFGITETSAGPQMAITGSGPYPTHLFAWADMLGVIRHDVPNT